MWTLPGDATRSAAGARQALVVEDEPHIRELVALHLGLEGLAVTDAGPEPMPSG